MGISLRTLAVRSFRAGKIRNLVAALAIVLTTVLFTTVTTIGMGAMESLTLTQQMAKGSKADGDFRYMTAEQFEQLKHADFIERCGLRMPVGYLTNTKRQNVEFDVLDETQAELTFCNPSYGTAPRSENEVVASDAALRDLGVEPKAGAVVPVAFTVRGQTYTFEMIVSGWYRAYGSQVSMMWAGTAFRDANPAIFAYTYPKDRAMAGTYDSDIVAKSTRGLQDQMNDWVCRVGGNPKNQDADNYIMAVVNQVTNAQYAPQTVWMGIAVAVLFMLCGYLLIFNVFDIAVMQEIRRYGLYRTIGMSKKQVRGLINLQAAWLSGISIPFGLFAGFLIGKAVLPMVVGSLSSEYENLVIDVTPSPLIFIAAAFFSAVTVYISTRKPVRVAANTPPIQAFRFVETDSGRHRVKHRLMQAGLAKMAWHHLGRNKRRSFSIMVSLMLCIVLLNSVGIAAGSLDVEKQVDFMIRTDFAVVNNVSANIMKGFTRRVHGLKRKTMRDIAKQPGVRQACAIYKNTLDDTDVTYDFGVAITQNEDVPGEKAPIGLSADGFFFHLGDDGRPLCNVYGMPETAIARMDIQEGETDPQKLFRRMQDGEGVLVGVPIDRSTMRMDQNLCFTQIGESITVYKNGKAVRTLPVLALAGLNGDDQEIGYTANGPFAVGGDGVNLYLPSAVYEQIYDKPTVYKYSFDVEENARAGMTEFLETYMNREDDSITYVSAESARQSALLDRKMITFVGGLIGSIFGIVGVLNLSNTMITTILTRRHVFATMQSIGMTKKQLARMVTLEGIFYAAGGCILGFLVSAALGFTLVRGLTADVWYFSFRFTLAPAGITCIILLIMGIWIPSAALGRFHKGSIVEKLRVTE